MAEDRGLRPRARTTSPYGAAGREDSDQLLRTRPGAFENFDAAVQNSWAQHPQVAASATASSAPSVGGQVPESQGQTLENLVAVLAQSVSQNTVMMQQLMVNQQRIMENLVENRPAYR